jgi:hypothetical protein
MRRVPLTYPDLTPVNAMVPGAGMIGTIKTVAQLEDLAALHRRVVKMQDALLIEKMKSSFVLVSLRTSGPLFGKHQIVSLAGVLYHTLTPDEEKKVLATYQASIGPMAKLMGVAANQSAKAPLNTRPGVTTVHTNLHSFFCDIRFDSSNYEWASNIPDHVHWHPGADKTKYEDPKLVSLKEAMASFVTWVESVKKVSKVSVEVVDFYSTCLELQFIYSALARSSKSIADILKLDLTPSSSPVNAYKVLAPWIDPKKAGEYFNVREVAQAFTRMIIDEAIPSDAWTDVLCHELASRHSLSVS